VAYTEESMDEVSLDLTQVLIFDHEKWMLLMLSAHQHSKPRLLCEPTTSFSHCSTHQCHAYTNLHDDRSRVSDKPL